LYLVAWCHLRQALRIFAVERMRAVTMLRRTFTVRADFDADAYLNKALGIVQGELVTVKVVFAKSLAPYIRERVWHPTQKLRDLPDGRLEMTVDVADTLELRRWILGYGVAVEIIAPAALRHWLRTEAAALAVALGSDRRPLALADKPGDKVRRGPRSADGRGA
jgi:predicted DNA-binding transcriptional regulator YafY